MSPRIAIVALLAWAGCSSGTGFPCEGVNGTCLGLTIEGSISSVDTIELTASGAFSGMQRSSTGHPSPLPVRLRVAYPANATGNVHVAVAGVLNGNVVGHGAGDASLKPGVHDNIVITLVPGPGMSTGDMGPTDMAAPPGSDLSGVPAGADMTLGADMYRATLAFSAKPTITVDANPLSLAIGNFQGKGPTDIVVACLSGNVAVAMQDAMGNYPGAATLTNVGVAASNVGVGRWHTGATRQGYVASAKNTIVVADNNGMGGFGTPASYPTYQIGTSAAAIAIGDFNNDNADDMAYYMGSDGSATPQTIFVAPSAGNGTFQQSGTMGTAPPAAYHPGETVAQLAAGNLGSGHIDLVATMGTSDLLILHNNGSGTFSFNAATDKHTVGSTPQFIAIADFDGNTKNDIAVANMGGGVSILLNDGNGNFPAAATAISAGSSPNGIAAADFDGDGNVDLAVTNTPNLVRVMLGDGKGHFSAGTTFTVGGTPSAMQAADVNGDVKPDIVVANQQDATVTVLINTTH